MIKAAELCTKYFSSTDIDRHSKPEEVWFNVTNVDNDVFLNENSCEL